MRGIWYNTIIYYQQSDSGAWRRQSACPAHPEIGEHNEEVLTELGFDAKQIEGLRASGAIPHVATLDATTIKEVNNE